MTVIEHAPIEGVRVTLLAVDADDPRLVTIDARRPVESRTGQAFARKEAAGGLPGTHLVLDRETEEAFGVINGFRPDPGAASVELTLFLDPRIARPGWAVEAYLLYARHLLAGGERSLGVTVIGGDSVSLRILRKLGLAPTARLREHEWACGCFHDVLVFLVDRRTFAHVDAILADMLGLVPGELVA